MNVGYGLAVLNPYEWLPSHGETSVALIMKGGDLSVIISYDGAARQAEKEMRFKAVCEFDFASIPGPNLLSLTSDEKRTTSLGSLVQYPESEAALAWTKHFGNRRNVKHYGLVFLAENRKLVVFADSVELNDVVTDGQ
jgi:uncharacterized membrane-anchored protein